MKYLKDEELYGMLIQKKIITAPLSDYLCAVKRKYAKGQFAE